MKNRTYRVLPLVTSVLSMVCNLYAEELVTVVVKNGGMTQGINNVSGWNGGMRDTNVFKVGSASLRIDGEKTAI
ncbi:MAG: hypothetical protein PF692_06175 [Kiritimatiellae bacterium]|jgi:hypothetical protein|nr:hypothetical protein [Kiritimatiellia bacterium]